MNPTETRPSSEGGSRHHADRHLIMDAPIHPATLAVLRTLPGLAQAPMDLPTGIAQELASFRVPDSELDRHETLVGAVKRYVLLSPDGCARLLVSVEEAVVSWLEGDVRAWAHHREHWLVREEQHGGRWRPTSSTLVSRERASVRWSTLVQGGWRLADTENFSATT